MTDATITAISLGITALGLVISWGLYRRRGAASALRAASLSLVPAAATMTGVTEFVMGLALNPVRWAGAALAGLAVLLYLTSGVMLSRRSGAEQGRAAASGPRERKAAGKAPGAQRPKAVEPATAADPEMAEIEEILRNRGIK